jgi:phospholipase/carboxylesterase
LLDTVEITRGARAGPAWASVIWLHGLGADGHDFEPVVPALALPAALAVRFVFPHAPLRPVTLNNGFVMRAWYDLYSLDQHGRADEAGLRASAGEIEVLIAREVGRGVPAARIVLAGFSQGGALALHTALRHAERLAGIMGLSCYLPLARTLAAEAHPANARTPVLLAHGQYDPVLPFAAGEHARDRLRELRYAVTWKSYPMPHSLCPEEIADISAFLAGALGRGDAPV